MGLRALAGALAAPIHCHVVNIWGPPWASVRWADRAGPELRFCGWRAGEPTSAPRSWGVGGTVRNLTGPWGAMWQKCLWLSLSCCSDTEKDHRSPQETINIHLFVGEGEGDSRIFHLLVQGWTNPEPGAETHSSGLPLRSKNPTLQGTEQQEAGAGTRAEISPKGTQRC